jgi:ABC-2 type transport system permease protein
MRRAMFNVMALSLFRDRAALGMSFLLPGIVFIVFALIFSGASGGDLALRLAVADERSDATTQRFVSALFKEARLKRLGTPDFTPDQVREAVRTGEADVGLIVRYGGLPLDDLTGDGAQPLELVGDPGREIAVSMLVGLLQKAYFAALPDAAIRSFADVVDKKFVAFSPDQKIRLAKGLEALRTSQEKSARVAPTANAPQSGTKEALVATAATAANSAPPLPVPSTATSQVVQGFRLDQLFERRDAVQAGRASSAVTYYAGAVAMLFLLFSALSGAMSYLDERETGLLDRLAIGPGGVGVLIDGKFMFLCAQGFLQVAAIYVVGWAVFGIDLWSNLLPWAATTLAAAVAAAGLALAFVTLCRSKQQAQSLGQMLILVVSAVGGSMVPRYLMPGYVQSLGWATPNTWALDAYSSIFARADGLIALLLPWAVLAVTGFVGLLAAHIMARRALAAVG